ncbi:hypothetical protein C0993_010351 [Termitomyces sp. T159_Od127]|nr:hypothetical protein C0993_010351 [Termitomyces sp. T159_Od127]
MVMVPIYAVSSLIALFSLEAAFVIDAIRDIYEAFSIGISVLVAARVINKLGPYTDAEHISLGLTDTLICLEMPIFAFAHMYAFSHMDYIDHSLSYVARMPMYFAFRDAFGLRDVIEDSKATLRGEGMDYREFEPAEGVMHQGVGRDRRIRAGLRYSKGGQRKYWLPQQSEETQAPGRLRRGVNEAISRLAGHDQAEDDVHAPIFEAEAESVVHLAPDLQDPDEDLDIWHRDTAEDGYELPFGDLNEGDEDLYVQSKKFLFGDYNYPVIDVSSENARINMWDEEERVLRDERGAWFSPIRGAKGLAALQGRDGPVWQGYGALGSTDPGTSGYHGSASTDGHDHPKVTMKWTKIRGRDHWSGLSTPRSQSPQLRNHHTSHATSLQSSVGSYNAASRIRSPPIDSRAGLSSPPILPPDAVDLLVEDYDAAEDENVRERKKGEPAVRGAALRKVYKRGFVTHTVDRKRAEGEIEVKEPRGKDRLEAGDDLFDAIGAEDADDLGRDVDSSQVPDTEGVIARAGTPPIHARVLIHEYDDDNPWA